MTGHISYPRAAAEANAKSDYEQAITLANGGEAERAKALLRDILDNPDATTWLKRLAEGLLTKLNVEAIQIALTSPDESKKFEGKIGKLVADAGFSIRGFQQEFGPYRSVGEIDIETMHYIIEVTTQTQRKKPQIQRLVTNVIINPNKKPVILYAENYNADAEKYIVEVGGVVVRKPDELIRLLHLEGNK